MRHYISNRTNRGGKNQSKKFWNKEYKKPEHLALSTSPSGDLQKFCRWLERNIGEGALNKNTKVLDLGCGNGRNSIYLGQSFDCYCVGYDISEEAISQAGKQAEKLGLSSRLIFSVRSLASPVPLADNSVDLVLDMMSSHFLKQKERELLHKEILRVLKPEGWLCFKSFLADEDLHVKRLLRDHPALEENAYIHPKFGSYEYVWTEEKVRTFFETNFVIEKLEKSHKHMMKERAFKRRSVLVYLRKKEGISR
jgi:ubiquinone/menaquinone biosynthesis C-methylase UbiE